MLAGAVRIQLRGVMCKGYHCLVRLHDKCSVVKHNKKGEKSMTSKLALFAALSILCIVPAMGLAQDTPFHDGDIAPDFTVQALDEEWVSLSDWGDSIVILDMWGTW